MSYKEMLTVIHSHELQNCVGNRFRVRQEVCIDLTFQQLCNHLISKSLQFRPELWLLSRSAVGAGNIGKDTVMVDSIACNKIGKVYERTVTWKFWNVNKSEHYVVELCVFLVKRYGTMFLNRIQNLDELLEIENKFSTEGVHGCTLFLECVNFYESDINGDGQLSLSKNIQVQGTVE